MIDNKGKLFSKISIVDILVVLVICLAVGGVYYKLHSGDNAVVIKSNTPIKATFVLNSVRLYTVDAAVIGDNLYEKNGQKLGKIVAVETKEAHKLIDLNDGRQINAPVDNRYDLYITIEGNGRISESGIYMNGNRLMLTGSDIKIRTKVLNCEATITNVGTGEV